MVLGISLAVGFACTVIWMAGRERRDGHRLRRELDYVKWAGLLFSAAFALRLALALFADSYEGDVEIFKEWARILHETGLKEVYNQNVFLDYPPGYLYVLGFLEKTRIFLGLDPAGLGFTLLIKLPSILGDLFCGGVLLRLAEKGGVPKAPGRTSTKGRRKGAGGSRSAYKGLSGSEAEALGGAFGGAFGPASTEGASVSRASPAGGTAVASPGGRAPGGSRKASSGMKHPGRKSGPGENRASALFIAGSYLFCPAVILNSAVWGQVDSFCVSILLGAILLLYRDRVFPAALVYGLAIVMKPQMLVFAPVFLFDVLRKRRYWMLPVGIAGAFAVILLVATPFTTDFQYLWLLERYTETLKSYNYYSVNAYNFWGLIGKNWVELPPGRLGLFWNVASPLVATLLCGWFMLKAKRDEVVWAAPVILMGTVYLFTVKMHERYLFPILVFLLLTYLYFRDRRLFIAFGGMATVHFLNVDYVLYLYQAFGVNYDPNEFLVKLQSFLYLLVFGYLMYVLWDILLRDHVLAAVPRAGAGRRPWQPLAPDSGFSRKEILLVTGITALYGVLAFWRLGSHEMAQSAWTPGTGEAVVVETPEPVDTLCFLSGLVPDAAHEDARVGIQVRLAISQDGENWQDAGKLEGDDLDYVFTWRTQTLPAATRYLRLTPLDGEVCLNEMALRDAWGERYQPVRVTYGDGTALFDEQALVPLEPSPYNSAYFDEIYHVRTAYEHILGLEPYEYTHPPLGKLLMSLGIRIFGLNPFGWRFMGTFLGMLMLPCLYYLLKRLFDRPFLAAAGMLVFALDFMHFTQTRIATIDTYAVFFILLMYGGMLCFLKKDLRTAGIRALSKPLAVSGIFMGLGIASKWTVVYGAAGLALLFFWKLWQSFREIRQPGYPLFPKRTWAEPETGREPLWADPFGRGPAADGWLVDGRSSDGAPRDEEVSGASPDAEAAAGPAAEKRSEKRPASPDREWFAGAVKPLGRRRALSGVFQPLSFKRHRMSSLRTRRQGESRKEGAGNRRQLYTGRQRTVQWEQRQLAEKMRRLCLWCCLWFLGIPFLLYFGAFLPMTTLPHNRLVSSFFQYQKSMLSYHANLDAVHAYQSPWYEWPFLIRPMWYYFNGELRDPGAARSISVLGNPAFWWTGVLSLGGTIVQGLRKRKTTALFLVTGFFAVYLPWVLISRSTFIYHYFTALPFLLMAVVYWMDRLIQSPLGEKGLSLQGKPLPLTRGQLLIGGYLLVNGILFLLFYPVLSGAVTTRAYLHWLEWLPGWVFGG